MKKVLDHTGTLQQLCKSSGKWGAYFNIHVPDYRTAFEELPKAALWFNWNDHGQSYADENGYILFDTEEEMTKTYEETVGDDGPTTLNPYNGPVRIYMITCDPTGALMHENT